MRPNKRTKQEVRWAILEMCNFSCVYCGKRASEAELKLTPTLLCVDHVFPWSKGGRSHRENFVVACEECNKGKKDKLLDPDTWLGARYAFLGELYAEEDRMDQIIAEATKEDILADYAWTKFNEWFYHIDHGRVPFEWKPRMLALFNKYGFDAVFEAYRTSYRAGYAESTFNNLDSHCERVRRERIIKRNREIWNNDDLPDGIRKIREKQ